MAGRLGEGVQLDMALGRGGDQARTWTVSRPSVLAFSSAAAKASSDIRMLVRRVMSALALPSCIIFSQRR